MLKQPDPKRNKVCQASIKYIIRSYIREFGYNIDPEAKYAGKHLSEETKEKIRQKALCRKISK